MSAPPMDIARQLAPHVKRLAGEPLGALVRAGGQRDAALQWQAGTVTLDARHQRLDTDAMDALFALAEARGFDAARAALLSGDIVNPTEERPALHSALRDASALKDRALAARIEAARARTAAFARACQGTDAPGGKPVTRIINIGIGGSDLGPRLVYSAMKAFRREGVDLRFVSNLDPADLEDAIEGADPETTLVCVTSKSFTTSETLMNARAAKAWLAASLGEEAANARMAAATAAPDRAESFGIAPARIFPFEEGVGGRYSFWSAAGLCLEIVLGPEVFARILEGARQIDAHFAAAPAKDNLPLAKALIDVWNRAGRGLLSRCVAAYSTRLELLPAYLQQLEMESLGKAVRLDGSALPAHSGGQLVWGGKGSDVQHSFFQWLHQGVDEVPVDFIAVQALYASGDERAKALGANLVAQTAALLDGHQGEGDLAAHKTLPGGRVSSVIMLECLDPEGLGALIAVHEHKVFCEGLIYGLNPFDQWGVELGKRLTTDLLEGNHSRFDRASLDLARLFRL
ncbi:glucose-6-phosphate isomerase [Glycocaulis abyssi]|uniref:Glucose-6-phosphate isomerase n=1 Tax=Glycocaulis abyssi TaxID=1433403 RepID=A0ABV9NF06_9PROT